MVGYCDPILFDGRVAASTSCMRLQQGGKIHCNWTLRTGYKGLNPNMEGLARECQAASRRSTPL
ncbi:hypothetical protein CHELA17_20118 [Chelatococcus asaccharovorans]|nr:hypothetical protein CHELA17_20118 [Chelatococcus asaccharovorans]